MKYTIYKAEQIYGGGNEAPEYEEIRKDISQEHVVDFFRPMKIINDEFRGGFKTEDDSMGCCTRYRIMVTGF